MHPMLYLLQFFVLMLIVYHLFDTQDMTGFRFKFCQRPIQLTFQISIRPPFVINFHFGRCYPYLITQSIRSLHPHHSCLLGQVCLIPSSIFNLLRLQDHVTSFSVHLGIFFEEFVTSGADLISFSLIPTQIIPTILHFVQSGTQGVLRINDVGVALFD